MQIAERIIASFILFYAAVVFCLPVPYSEEVASLYPWWAKKIGIGNALLHEIVFIVWIVLFGWRFVLRSLLNRGLPARQAAFLLIILALWCGLISLGAPLAMQDMGRTLRLLLMAALMLAVVRWTRKMNNTPLVMLILGFLSGTIINLVMSFKYPFVVNETMRLSGQNTPGVAMGIAIHLAAWLFFRTDKRAAQVLAVIASLIFAFSCAISYSRIGWFAGGLGVIAWAYLICDSRPSHRLQRQGLKKLRWAFLPVAVIALLIAPRIPAIQLGIEWIQILFQQKIAEMQESDDIRWAYLTGTLEIVSRNPFGVGYSGFYDAMTATDTYQGGNAAQEDSPADANPHASLLWYTTAGGIPGGVIATMVLILMLNSLRFGLCSATRNLGSVLFLLIALPFGVIYLTVPYIFNSIILVVPTAIAAGWGGRNG